MLRRNPPSVTPVTGVPELRNGVGVRSLDSDGVDAPIRYYCVKFNRWNHQTGRVSERVAFLIGNSGVVSRGAVVTNFVCEKRGVRRSSEAPQPQADLVDGRSPFGHHE